MTSPLGLARPARLARLGSLAPGLAALWIACAPAAPPRPPAAPAATAAPAAATAATATGPSRPSRVERQAFEAQATDAYDRKDFAACAQLFDRAHDPYSAACCHAQAAALDAAFAALDRAIADGMHDRRPEADTDLDPLHGDPRWQAALDRLAAKTAEHRATLNPELTQLFDDDQGDRNAKTYESIDWSKVAPRDEARRKRVDEIIAAGGAHAADDYYHAAMVYQHGNAADEIQRAHDLAAKAVELDPAHDAARWLAAAAEDRKLMYEYKPQKWGTQYKKVDGKWIVWPVDPAITDAQRAEWDAPPLAHAYAHAAAMNAAMKKAQAGAAK
jgi:hypothetical protein